MEVEKKKNRILIVDDEKDFRELLKFWLESKGYEVIIAINGQDAIQKTKNQNLDLIFMDLHMPIMDGKETIKQIREFNKDIPIVVISAYIEDAKVKEAMEYNISGAFYKGEDFEKGLVLLETVLRRHRGLK